MATPLRNLRISDDEWEALGAFATAKQLDRTAVVRSWIHDNVPAEFWPKADELEGQSTIFDV